MYFRNIRLKISKGKTRFIFIENVLKFMLPLGAVLMGSGLGFIISCVCSKHITYQYDLLGNRTQKSVIAGTTTTTNFEYNVANEITNVNGTPQYTHDYNGNIIVFIEGIVRYNDIIYINFLKYFIT